MTKSQRADTPDQSMNPWIPPPENPCYPRRARQEACRMDTAVIIAVGREILRGRVHDSNSWTLARRLTSLGVRLLRIVACDDDSAAIVREVHRAREDGATLIVATGGLGPTDEIGRASCRERGEISVGA